MLQGDLRFLIGPNGAGKTTLAAITGLAPATGSVRFGRTELIGKKVHRIVRLSVGRTFQTASVFEELTVLQNLDIAAGAGRSPLSLLRRRSSVPPEVEQAMDAVGLTGLRDRPAGELAHGQKQWLEIAMLLVQNARVLLLDEPVAGISADERVQTGELLRRIGASAPWWSSSTDPVAAAVGLLRPTPGRILLDGEDITRMRPNERVKRGLGYVPQGQQCLPQLTTEENLELVADTRRGGRKLIALMLDLFPALGGLLSRRAGFFPAVSGSNWPSPEP